MVSSTAYRPSDVINSHSGQTIEVMNTDAEGRLVLADCLSYVQDVYKPRLIVDLATLTGAMMIALGQEYCGTFVNDDALWNGMEKAGRESGEKIWRMPLDEAFRKELDSHIADIKSLGNLGRYGGACVAAGFLERFIKDKTPWAHMDIAGTAWIKGDKPTCPKPATGYGVRLLDRLVAAYE
jgi:leucyl aminopeptidase